MSEEQFPQSVIGAPHAISNACSEERHESQVGAGSLRSAGGNLYLWLVGVAAAGVLLVAGQASAVDFPVSTDAGLRVALNPSGGAQNGDTITFTANITLTADLPVVQRDIVINGNTFTLSGNDQYRGLLVQAGAVTVNDLSIVNAKAQGGNGGTGRNNGGGGGGGAGLGGALFVTSGATVTVNNVLLLNNSAQGGNGGAPVEALGSSAGGGGGGMGGNGGVVDSFSGVVYSGGGGGLGVGADGAARGNSGASGIAYGLASGGAGAPGASAGAGGLYGGGGGSSPSGGGGGGIGGATGPQALGGFGGGGGGGTAGINNNTRSGGIGGFGGGGGGAGPDGINGGAGGFGGGGGGMTGGLPGKRRAPGAPGAGGVGGGQGGGETNCGSVGCDGGGGGGGAGMGGAIFVQQGGTLALKGALSVNGNQVGGGSGAAGAGNGNALGQGFFLQGNGTLTFAPESGKTQAVQNAIGDLTGSFGSGGSWSLVKNGGGTTILTGDNFYTGGNFVNGGTLQGSAGSLKGNTVNNASVVFDQTGTGTYNANMSGTGSLTKIGDGTLVLAGTNTYTGGTTVSAGTLQSTTGNLNGGIVNNSSVVFNQTFDGTYASSMSGTGRLAKTGSGTVTLGGVNSYSGGTTVNGGILRFTSDANLGANGGGITLSDSTVGTTDQALPGLTISRAMTLGGVGGIDVAAPPMVWAGVIGGSGALQKSGAGELALTGSNTYSGGTSVTFGTLRISSNDNLGAAGASLTLKDNATLAAGGNLTLGRPIVLQSPNPAGGGGGVFLVESGGLLTLPGVVSGNGELTKVGGGILALTGANAYQGPTLVNGGTLRGNATSLRGNIRLQDNISAPSAVVFDQGTNAAYTGNITGVGSLTKIGAGTLSLAGTNTYNGGTTISAGVLQGTTSSLQGNIVNDAAVVFDQAVSGTYAGSITGSGTLAKNGVGEVNLSGISNVGGGTAINGGSLAVNGRLTSNVVVNTGGELMGSGNIVGSMTLNGGTLAPGNSIGTMNIVGSFTQAAGSTYQVETNAAGQADRVNVSGAPGTATIPGGTVAVTGATGVYAPSTTYTILNATGGVTGTYAGTSSLFPFLQPSLGYDANNVYLTLKPGGFGAGAATANQSAVGRVLDQSVAGSSGDFATVIGTMATYTQAQGQAAMNAISGQNYSGFGTANLGGGLLFMNMLGQQMSLARGGFGSGNRVAVAQACEASLAEACDGEGPSPWSLWGSAMGGTGSVAGNANTATLTYNAGGVATGVDYRFDQHFLAGIGVGFSSGNQWLGGFSGKGTTNSYQASLYASFTQAAFYLNGLAGYGYNDNQMTRQIVLPNLAPRLAQGRTGANQLLGQAEAGYRIGIHEPAAASITPFARFQGTTVSQSGFSESGAGALNLNVAPQTTGSARSVLGAELAGAFGPDGREKLALQLRLGWVHEYAGTARPVTANFAGAPGANFTVFGAAPQRDAATVSLAANTAVAPGASLYLRYDGEMGTGTTSHALNGGLRVSW